MKLGKFGDHKDKSVVMRQIGSCVEEGSGGIYKTYLRSMSSLGSSDRRSRASLDSWLGSGLMDDKFKLSLI